MRELEYPIDTEFVNRKIKSIKRQVLSEDRVYVEKKIAVLGGSTTASFIECLEVFLLNNGIKSLFYESEYNRYYEDAVFENFALDEFRPDIVIIYTTCVNLNYDGQDFERLKTIADSLFSKYNCIVIQNNMDYPQILPMGAGDLLDYSGKVRYVNSLNVSLLEYADDHVGYYVHDMNYLCTSIGLDRWHNRIQYYSYKMAVSMGVVPLVAFNMCRLINAIYGKSKKCLVVDLDGTLWGGIIGDVGVEGITLGNETPKAESYLEVQKYLLDLKKRGIILAVCSKNDEKNARSGFSHPDSVLHENDFAVFKANWNNKDQNLIEIATELNIGIDSLVFLDDNPAEREIVRQSLNEVTVLEVDAANPYTYIQAISESGVFDTVRVSSDDLMRSANYEKKAQEKKLESMAVTYDEFLQSLEMKAEIKPFEEVYYDRIAQLTNKSNQFNLTTLRCTVADVEMFADSDRFITLYGRLEDKFGDNGLVSVIVAEKKSEDEAEVILWLMSCRVLKRNMEYAMFQQLVDLCRRSGISKLTGTYYPTAKNGMVSNLYGEFGFDLVEEDERHKCYEMILESVSSMKDLYIEIVKG